MGFSHLRRFDGLSLGITALLTTTLAATMANVMADPPPVGSRMRWMEVPGDGKLRAPRTSANALAEDWSNGWANYTAWQTEQGTISDILAGNESYFKPSEKNWFPLNYGLLESPLPGDFLPVGSTLGAHTLALVPNRLATKSTSWNGLTRATLEDAVDLVTGVPLVQFSDLSLPFNGTQFRLIRTRSATRGHSGRPSHSGLDIQVREKVSASDNRWWDWVGSGWMMSENPVLIIDSTMADDVGTGLPRCSLWLDAFHSIPFDWVDGADGKGFYDCAPRFRAKMIASRLNGTVRKRSDEDGGPRRRTDKSLNEVPNAGQWLDFPDRFEISLFDGELTYQFTPVWQDVPSWQYEWKVHPPLLASDTVWTSMHERPWIPLGTNTGIGVTEEDSMFTATKGPWTGRPINSDDFLPGQPKWNGRGLGMPYIGLLTKISDRFNNRAEIDYTPLTEWDDHVPQPDGADSRVQFTTQKGQVREIRLKSGEDTTHWTLLYAYRMVPRAPAVVRPYAMNADWDGYSLQRKLAWSDPALDTIYVFEGAVNTKKVTLLRAPNDSLGSSSNQDALRPNDSNDILASYIAGTLPAALEWPGDAVAGASELTASKHWRFRCRYHYDITTYDSNIVGSGFTAAVASPPVLVRAQMDQRATSQHTSAAKDRNFVFLYGQQPGFSHTPWLTHLFDDSGIDRAAGALAASSPTHEDAIRNVLALPQNIDSLGSAAYAAEKQASDIHEAASLWFNNSTEDSSVCVNDSGDYRQASPAKVTADQLLKGKPGQYFADSMRGTVGAVSLTDQSGRRRYFRLSRYLFAPAPVGDPEIHPSYLEISGGNTYFPMRSIFHSPYWWQAYAHFDYFAWPENELVWKTSSVPKKEVNYTDARWVSMVDEFSNWHDLRSSGSTPIGTGTAQKVSFFEKSKSRVIVGMNPLGNVLWQKSYFLSGNRFTESGNTGLTEDYVYKTGGELMTHFVEVGTIPQPDPKDIQTSFKIERFLVAKKSTGYAAGAIDNGNTLPPPLPHGLISTFDYDIVSNSATTPWTERVRLVAQGIKDGDEGATKYLSQTLYHPSDPTIVLGSVQFTSPTTTLFAQPTSPTLTYTLGSYFIAQSRVDKDQDADGNYRKLVSRSISARHSLTPDASSTAYCDVSIDVTGPTGLSAWSISAFVTNPDTFDISGDPHALVKFTYSKYDPFGRIEHSWEDVDPNDTAIVSAGDFGLLPETLRTRKSPVLVAAALHTEYRYDNDGMSDIIYPNGQRWARRTVRIPGDTDPDDKVNDGKSFTRVFTFNDLTAESTGGLFKTLSLCSIKDYSTFTDASSWSVDALRSGRRSARSQSVLRQSRQVWFTSSVDISVAQNYTGFEEAPKLELSYDSSGRVTAATSLDIDWSGNSSSVAQIQDNGDRIRTKEMDGNSTMQLRNSRGQIVRTYTGTNAFSWIDDTYTTPESPAAEFDCILTGRTEFGTGLTNAMLPVRQWKYLQTPSLSATADGWTADNLRPFGPAPANDPEGELTETTYDWRMRAVRIDVSAAQPSGGTARPHLSTRLTYLDHADRTVLEVSFGSGELGNISSIDPSTFGPESQRLKTPGDIASLVGEVLNLNPTSVVETRYFEDGSVRERLTYRAHGTGYTSGSSNYLAERYGYGAGGKQIFAQQPGSPTQITTLDNMGRVLSEASVLPRGSGASTTYDYELSRTDYGYDADGQVIITDRWERIMPGGSGVAPTGIAALDASNAVRQRTENWYDSAKRVVATAEYGSENTDGIFAMGSNTTTLATRLAARLDTGTAGQPGQRTRTPLLRVQGIDDAPGYSVDLNGVSVGNGLLTVHAYDRAGNKIATASPRAGVGAGATWTYSRSLYDAKGRLFLQTDDVTGAARKTAYSYWLGRTVNISSPRTADLATEQNTTWQTQGVAYGAEIVAEDFRGGRKTLKYVSRNNSLVGAMMSTNSDRSPGTGKLNKDDSATPAVNEPRPDVILGINDFNYGSFFHFAATEEPVSPEVFVYQPDFVYRYYADGLLAERVDRRKLAMRYFYDEQRRLKEVEVWNYAEGDNLGAPLRGVANNIYKLEDERTGYPPSMTAPSGVPADRVGFVAYEYDNRGNVTRVTSRTSRTASTVISDTKFTYDERNNLTKEYQAQGQSADDPAVPFITYVRAFTSATPTASGRDRLTSMTYPVQSGLSASRVLTMGYGVANSPDDSAGRIGSMTMGTAHVASFGYTGSGRRASLKMGGTAASPKIFQNFDTASYMGLEGLDAFGRVKDLRFATTATPSAASDTLWRGEYGYDAAGNRQFERLTQRPVPTVSTGANSRSRFFGFDALDRLVTANSGALNASNDSVGVSDAYPTVRAEGWNFDQLGNWAKSGLKDPSTTTSTFDQFDDPCHPIQPPSPPTLPWDPELGQQIEFPRFSPERPSDGHYVALGTSVTGDSQLIGDKAEIKNMIRREQHLDAAGAESWKSFVYDPCGNLTFDGDYLYQYDAWGRLIEVRAKGNLIWQKFLVSGLPLAKECATGYEAGPLVKHFTYDGVGRLIRTTTPLNAESGYELRYYDDAGNAHFAISVNRSERFFYDGVRRIQELVKEPVLVTSGEHDTVSLAEEIYHGQAGYTQPDGTAAYVRAQYIWGPGDNGVDELLCQLDPRDTSSSSYSGGGGKPWYVLTDAQGDVVSLAQISVGTNQPADVAGQWTYSPYGEVLTYERFHPHPAILFGHKTLAVDRLDGEAVDWDFDFGYVSENRRLAPGARLLAYARNRTLDISRGRWLQQDPNASGSSLLSTPVYNGEAPNGWMLSASAQQRSSNGINLFAYLGEGPLTRSDPMGLLINELVMPYATIGLTAGKIGYGLVSQYSERQEYDADWASDWAAPDDAHSRLDNSWISDIYREADINETVDDFANPFAFNSVASEITSWYKKARALNKEGKVAHHVISWYQKTKARLEQLKKTYKFQFSPWELDNMLALDKASHRGRHRGVYHNRVFEHLESKLKGLSGDAARQAFMNGLEEIKQSVIKNPANWFDP